MHNPQNSQLVLADPFSCDISHYKNRESRGMKFYHVFLKTLFSLKKTGANTTIAIATMLSRKARIETNKVFYVVCKQKVYFAT
jgi:hypothetical protein